MRVHIGSDHAGFQLKTALTEHLSKAGHTVIDHGSGEFNPDDDYPGPCINAAIAVAADPGSLGFVLGGSGNGEQIAANKVTGIRAALIWNTDTATLAREHNDANVAAIGARMHDQATSLKLADTFLAATFSDNERHRRRIVQLSEYETTGETWGVPEKQ